MRQLLSRYHFGGVLKLVMRDDAPTALLDSRDHFSVDLKIISNIKSLIPNKKLPPSLEYSSIIVKIGEETDFFGLGDFIELEKVFFDITPLVTGEYIMSITLRFVEEETGFVMPEPEDEEEQDEQPQSLKLCAKLPPGEISEFIELIAARKHFFLFISTPSYEGRVVVRHKTGAIITKVYEERGYKIQ